MILGKYKLYNTAIHISKKMLIQNIQTKLNVCHAELICWLGQWTIECENF